MANQDPLGRSRYFHHVSAFGIAGQIDRPVQQTIPTQASISLGPTGGHAAHQVNGYKVPGILSFSGAYVEVGGDLDESNDTYASYSSSVIEDLNIFNVLKADRVVSRLTVYRPAYLKNPVPQGKQPEPSFSITGSHFDNLRIAGQKIDVEVANDAFHDSDFSTFYGGAGKPPCPNREWLIGSNIDPSNLPKSLPSSDHNYDIVNRIAERYKQCHPPNQPPMNGHHFWCSAARSPNQTQSSYPTQSSTQPAASKPSSTQSATGPGDLTDFGHIICVPRFGVIYLAEMVMYRNHRHLTMIRVHLASTAGGNIDGPGTGGGGGGTLPPG